MSMTEKRRTEARKEQLTQAVLDLAGTRGIKRVSMAAVARKVGLVPSAIYRHFSGKQAMIEAVLDTIGARLVDNVRAAAMETEDPVEQLRKLVMKHVEMIRENSAIPRMIFSEDLLAAVPGRKQRVYRFVERYLEDVSGLIRNGQKQRRIRRDVPAPALAYMTLGMIQPAALLWYLSDGDFDVTRLSEKSFALFRELLDHRH